METTINNLGLLYKQDLYFRNKIFLYRLKKALIATGIKIRLINGKIKLLGKE